MNDKKTEVAQTIEEAVGGPGIPMDIKYSGEKVTTAKHTVAELKTGKAIRTVSDWQIWDVLFEPVSTEMQATLKENKIFPVMLYAGFVIDDTSGKFDKGSYIRSSLMQHFNGRIFETKNTIYILSGAGIRKKVDSKIAFSPKWYSLEKKIMEFLLEKNLIN